MRRKDREIVDREKILEIISTCFCCRLGLYDEGEIYIVPLNFGYSEDDGKLSLYFHGAREGRKMDLIKKSKSVGFEMDMGHELITSDVACGHSARYKSIIGTGRVSIIEGLEEKRFGLKKIMEKNTEKTDWEFPDKMVEAVEVFKLDVEKLSCKEHL